MNSKTHTAEDIADTVFSTSHATPDVMVAIITMVAIVDMVVMVVMVVVLSAVSTVMATDTEDTATVLLRASTISRIPNPLTSVNSAPIRTSLNALLPKPNKICPDAAETSCLS